MQQVAGIADVQGLGDGRQLRRAQINAEVFWALTQQRGDAVALAHLLGLQLWHAGLNRRKPGIGAHHIEFITDAGITQADSDGLGVLLVFQVLQGDMFTQLCAAQFTVSVHQLGNHGHLQLIQVCRSSLFVGIAGLQLTLDTAKQVDFPGHVQAQIVALTVDALFSSARHLPLAHIAAGTAGDGRHGFCADVITNGAGCPQTGKGHAQLTVAC